MKVFDFVCVNIKFNKKFLNKYSFVCLFNKNIDWYIGIIKEN